MNTHTPPTPTSKPWPPAIKMAVGIISLVIVGIAFWQILEILPMLVLALLFGYLLYPLATTIQNRLLGGKRRALAVLLSLLIFAIIAVIVVVLLLPPLITQIRSFADQLPTLVSNLREGINNFLGQPITIFGETYIPLDYIKQATGAENLDELFANINPGAFTERIINSITSLIAPTFSIVGRVFGTLISFTIFFTLLFYLLRDGDKFINGVIHTAPTAYEGDMRRAAYELNGIWSAYLRGQLLLCLAVGVLTYIAALIVGLPSPLIIGVVAGFLELIPNIGPLITAFIAGFLALVSQSSTFPGLDGVTFALVTIAIQFAIQQIEAIFLVPRIMGENLELHPFMVMLAVLAGGALGGALGVILAAPGLATLRLLVRYIYAKLTDQPPFKDHEPATIPIESSPAALPDQTAT